MQGFKTFMAGGVTLVLSVGTAILADPDAVKTIGQYWPWLTGGLSTLMIILRAVTKTPIFQKGQEDSDGGTKLMSVGLLACLLMGLVACAGHTPLERAYDLANKFEAVQLVAEEVVTDESVPLDVRRYVQASEKLAREAVVAYARAVQAGGDTGAFLTEGLKAVMDLTAYLIQKGFLTREEAAAIFDPGQSRSLIVSASVAPGSGPGRPLATFEAAA